MALKLATFALLQVGTAIQQKFVTEPSEGLAVAAEDYVEEEKFQGEVAEEDHVDGGEAFESLEIATEDEVDFGAPLSIAVAQDRYWKCARKGINNKHGFGFNSLAACAAGVAADPACKLGKFDYNKGYNGQCKCVTADTCEGLAGIRGYVAYQSVGWQKLHQDRYWNCPRKGIANTHGFGHKTLDQCIAGVEADKQCIAGQFDYNKGYNGQCKCVTTAKCTGVRGIRGYETYAFGGLKLVTEDRYWNCARKGMGSTHGFGHTLQSCAKAVAADAKCKGGKFDYNQKYNGQCKCVTADDCTGERGIRGYNTYILAQLSR